MVRPLHPLVSGAFPGAPRVDVPTEALSSVPYRHHLDEEAIQPVLDDLRGYFSQADILGYAGVTVGLSGGLDSAVCIDLCRRALGAERVAAVTVLMGPDEERQRLSSLGYCAKRLGVRHIGVDGESVRQALIAAWPGTGPWTPINLETRTIQALIFQVADSLGFGVCATTDRSELLLGRQTESFYGHVSPLLGFYKTDVRFLAGILGIEDAVQDHRPGCTAHWYDDEVLGADYEVIDPILHLLTVDQLSLRDISRQFGIADEEWLRKIEERVRFQPLRLGIHPILPLGAERS